jgi:broad specificity phosphatase PhoE
MLIYLVRHGETAWNRKKRLQGQTDIPLNGYGEELAQETAKALKSVSFDRVFSSPLIRAERTAEILTAGSGLPILTDSRLTEMNFGIAEGLPLPFIRRFSFLRIYKCFYDPAHYTRPVPGGELIKDVKKRGMDFLCDAILPLESTCSSILITAHGGIIRGIISSLNQIPDRDFWDKIPEKNCAVNLLELKNGSFTVLEIGKLFYKPAGLPSAGPL